MKNIERIKRMTAEEFAKLATSNPFYSVCKMDGNFKDCKSKDCWKCWVEWLNTETER